MWLGVLVDVVVDHWDSARLGIGEGCYMGGNESTTSIS